MASVNPLISRYPTKRRTSRIAVLQNIGISGQDRSGQEFTIGGKATNLNLHGGSILLPRQLSIGATLKVRNNQKMEAAVKVVSQTKPVSGMHSYGVQFVDDAAGFWGIHFPPTR
jgi:hypothetical protein